jgi:hypothetical protein
MQRLQNCSYGQYFYLSIKFNKNMHNAIILSPKLCMHCSTNIIFKTTIGWHYFLVKFYKMGLWLLNKHCTLILPNKLGIPPKHYNTLYSKWNHTMEGLKMLSHCIVFQGCPCLNFNHGNIGTYFFQIVYIIW